MATPPKSQPRTVKKSKPKAVKKKSAPKQPEKAAKKSTVVNLRVTPETCRLIDWAAEVAGKNRTEFMVEAARRAAEEVLLDRRLYVVDGATFDAFVEILDRPPEDNPRLRELLETPAPWEG